LKYCHSWSFPLCFAECAEYSDIFALDPLRVSRHWILLIGRHEACQLGQSAGRGPATESLLQCHHADALSPLSGRVQRGLSMLDTADTPRRIASCRRLRAMISHGRTTDRTPPAQLSAIG